MTRTTGGGGVSYSVNSQSAAIPASGDYVGGYDASAAAEKKFLAEEVAALAAGHQGYVVGRWYYPWSWYNSSATATLVAGRVYYTHFYVGKKTTFANIGIGVQTGAASSVARLGIYNVAGGIPTTLAFDGGTVSTATTGEKTVNGTTLEPGFYALAVISDGAPVLFRPTADSTGNIVTVNGETSGPNSTVGLVVAHYETGSGSVLPSSAGSLTAITGVVSVPLIGLKA